MKNFLLTLVSLCVYSTLLYSQNNQVPFYEIKGIAINTAQSLWGNVSSDTAIPYYSKNDEIGGYRFNFSFNKSFPDKEALMESCKTNYEKGDKDSQWGIGEYGYTMVSARKDLDVTQSYSGGLLTELYDDDKINTTTDPEYYQFIDTHPYWCAIGVRNNSAGDDWDIMMYDDNSFSNVIASSMYGGETVDFVVMDGNHSPQQYRGIKVDRYSGSGTASVEYEDNTETLLLGDNTYSWVAGDVVEMYDIYLDPGLYGFTLDVTSGSSNLDFALFGSSGSPYYAPRSSYLAASYSGGNGGDEHFTYEITTADWYGVCVWANDSYSASYNINVGKAGTWTGLGGTPNWHVPANWSGNIIPDASMDVTIPAGTPNDPGIWLDNAYCNNITLESGANLSVYDKAGAGYTLRLYVSNDFIAHGNVYMWGGSESYDGEIQIGHDAKWYSGSSIYTTVNDQIFRVYGDWYMYSGAQIHMGNGKIMFMGNQNAYIESYESSCYLNDVMSYKTDGAYVGFSYLSTTDIYVNGDMYIQTGAAFNNYNTNHIYLHGDINNYGTFIQDYGTLVMAGNSQYIGLTPGCYLNNFTVNSSGNVYFINNGSTILTVNKDLTIDGGELQCGDFTINVGGNWTNNVGDSGFDEGAGRVVFNGGNYNQYCSNETFNELEIYKPAGGAFMVNGNDVICAGYDWTAGSIEVFNGGTFTANDLIDNGIFGKYVLSDASSTINLTNTDGDVDLDGEIHINNGTMNVYSEPTTSYWPWAADAAIFMSGGVLDFHDQGIWIYDSPTYSLTENISGGVIRTSGGFLGDRADFTPSAGTFEFYGSSDYYISQSNGCTLYNVNIDKSTKNSNAIATMQPVIDERSKQILSPGSKSNTVLLWSDFVVTNNLTIASGELKLNGHSLTVGHNCEVYGTLTMDNAADILTQCNYHGNWVMFYAGSTGNFSNGIANICGWIVPKAGCSFTATTNNTIYFKGVGGGGLSNFEPTAVYGNIVIDKNAYQTIYIDGMATEPIVVNGSFTINPDNILLMQDKTMIVHGAFNDASSSEIYVYSTKKSATPEMRSTGNTAKDNSKSKGGHLELDNDFTLNGLLDVGNGDVLLHGDFQAASTSTITINGGTFIDDAPFLGNTAWNIINGGFNMTDGLFELTNNSIYFDYDAFAHINGGIIRCGGDFWASDQTVFVAYGGMVELTAKVPMPSLYSFISNDFYNLTINAAYGDTVHYMTHVNVKNNLTIEAGSFECGDDPASNYDLRIGGDWIDNPGGFIANEGSVTFDYPGDVIITPEETFYDLRLEKSSGDDRLTLTDNVTVLNDLLIYYGGLMTGANTLDVSSNVQVYSSSGAFLIVQAGGTLKIGDNKTLQVDTNSHFYMEGSSSDQATLTHSGSGRYSCNISGEIAANYATFEYMNGDGIFLNTGATVNSTNSFNHCVFRNGAPSPSTLLGINASVTFTADNCYFENTSGNTTYNVWKSSSAGNITFTNSSGDFAGPEFEYDPFDEVDWGTFDVDMALTVMLEGPYNGIDMNTDLNTHGLIPLSQPFNSNINADWYYTGTESVSSIPANVVDWVLVQIRDASDAASADAGTVVAEQAAFLLNDGSIVDLDGSSNLYFPGISYSSGLFPVVWHRNHLGVISADRMTRSGGVYTYDFTTNINKAYQSGQKSINGKAALFGGDIDANGTVNNTDKIIWSGVAGTKGYQPSDTDMNGEVDNKDKDDVWSGNLNEQTKVPN